MGAKADRIVGIDLGTTHTVVAEAEAGSGSLAPKVLSIAQLVTPTEVQGRELLPSCLYAPLEHERFPDVWGDHPWVVGELARRRGAEVPSRFVASAKSWLAHGAVDRTAAILPWGQEGVPRISPLGASAKYLGHVRRAYDAASSSGRSLSDQSVVLTVPASFDEAARELTVQAAASSGLRVRLLEEPQAAFYDWLGREGDTGIELLLGTEQQALVLVCDVGGGTTDLSLIRVVRRTGNDPFLIERVAVGTHLLLGGDNMDLALAHAAESRLVEPGQSLDAEKFSELVLACRSAKERLLSDGAPDSYPVSMVGSGARLVGNARSTRLARSEVEQIVLEGFFPMEGIEMRPDRRRTALVGFGLPYERDVAITRHIASFLARHRERFGLPSALLLNGGVFRAGRISTRLSEVIGRFSSAKVTILSNPHPDLAVALGAVAHGLATAGFTRRIKGGSARGYYLGLEARDAKEKRPLLAVIPRGAEEGSVHVVRDRPLQLLVGKPARFDLFASDDAPAHAPGTLVPLDEEQFTALPPLATTLEGGAGEAEAIPVALEGEVSPVGTLDLSLVEIGNETSTTRVPRRFRLAFQLRGVEPAQGAKPVASPPGGGSAHSRRLTEARAVMARAFGRGTAEVQGREAKDLVRDLERLLGERPSWTVDTCRTLFDALWPDRRARRRSPDHERVYWMLAGYCIRPGFGAVRDEERTAALFSIFSERIAFPDQARGWQQFWIAWRRAAGGLGESAQVAIREIMDGLIAPAGTRKRPKGWRPEAASELVELAASLERVPALRRAELGNWILERTWTDRDPRLRTAVGRIGARIPAYASVHYVVSPRVAEGWLDHLIRENWKENLSVGAAAVQIARKTGDRARDISDALRRDVERKLKAVAAPAEWIRLVNEVVALDPSERERSLGDDLPVGLRLAPRDGGDSPPEPDVEPKTF